MNIMNRKISEIIADMKQGQEMTDNFTQWMVGINELIDEDEEQDQIQANINYFEYKMSIAEHKDEDENTITLYFINQFGEYKYKQIFRKEDKKAIRSEPYSDDDEEEEIE